MRSVGWKLVSAGTLIGAVGLVRIQVLVRDALMAHPREMESLLERIGFSSKPVEASMMIVAYQYAVLRRAFPEIEGTSLERERRALLLCYVLLFAGCALSIAGIAIEIMGARAI